MPSDTTDAICNTACKLEHGSNDALYQVMEASCAESSSASCKGWSPAGNITHSNGVYHVDATWLADTIDDPEPLWACDDAVLSPHAAGEFEIDGASSGEALYELGLRDGDIPVSLNGEPLGTFGEAFAAFTMVLNAVTEFDLLVKRGGNKITLSYVVE